MHSKQNEALQRASINWEHDFDSCFIGWDPYNNIHFSFHACVFLRLLKGIIFRVLLTHSLTSERLNQCEDCLSQMPFSVKKKKIQRHLTVTKMYAHAWSKNKTDVVCATENTRDSGSASKLKLIGVTDGKYSCWHQLSLGLWHWVRRPFHEGAPI